MNQHPTAARLPQRMLTTAGSVLLAGGLAAAMFAGAPALAQDTAPVTAQAVVDNAISLTADDATVTLTGLPGEATTASSGLVATSNNLGGYNVTVQAGAANMAGTGTNTDVIAVGTLSVGGSAASDTAPVQIHTQDVKSAELGDAIPVPYALTMPHVNADVYSVGLTFTATAN